MAATTTTTAEHIAALEAMTTRQAGAEYVATIKGAALTALARAAHAHFLPTVADRRERIVERFIGGRLNSATIRRR